MLTIVTTKKFEKSLQRMRKRGKAVDKIKYVIEQLSTKGILESRYKKHPLVGNWQGFYECHIEPDWLLIYKIDDNELLLAETGTHSDLFF